LKKIGYFLTGMTALVAWSSLAQTVPGMSAVTMFSGDSGQAYSWEQLFVAMDDADVIVIGESHTDSKGHAIQSKIIAQAGRRWDGLTLSLEEFDRSQQAVLLAYERHEITGAELKATRRFVDLAVRDNWMKWNLPKIRAARQVNAPLLASNAPLKYSRMVRDAGCDNLPDLADEELALFNCPAVAEDPAYKARFAARFAAAISQNKSAALKPITEKQIDMLFRAQRVWDATMAASIVQARADGAKKVMHVVGGVHSEFDGGLIQELRHRDKDSRILVICMCPKRSDRLARSDRGKADIIIYTRN
jgi:uncharacterized iron-regulated protein